MGRAICTVPPADDFIHLPEEREIPFGSAIVAMAAVAAVAAVAVAIVTMAAAIVTMAIVAAVAEIVGRSGRRRCR